MSKEEDDNGITSKIKALAITVGRSVAPPISDIKDEQATAQSASSDSKKEMVVSDAQPPAVVHDYKTDTALGKQQRLDLEKIAVGMYLSYVLQTSRDPLSLNSFYDSAERIHNALHTEFQDVPIKVQYCLALSGYTTIFQDNDSSFTHLQQLLTNNPEFRSEKQEFLAEENEKHRTPRFNKSPLEPWSHVTYTVDGFAHVHVSYEDFSPLQLFNIVPGNKLQKLYSFYKYTDGKRNLRKAINGGIVGGAVGTVWGYVTSFSLTTALLSGLGGGMVNVSRDLLQNPIYGTAVDFESAIDSSVPKEEQTVLTGHLENFVQTITEECRFQYKRDSTIAIQMREYMRTKAAEAKKRR
ncbi:MAG: hypothetical protein Q8R37_02710 [Nanoarchaeota archaeon]|nr:hypothetical protein [Nanoarchaeota archaeon]